MVCYWILEFDRLNIKAPAFTWTSSISTKESMLRMIFGSFMATGNYWTMMKSNCARF